ncbi:MAG: hypothetical protein EAZ85_03335 [Bacteroidetes bacterium]|nr:MAG: hypothetical protein EAZ85_03335 [Bacteroidota bacterium]
MELYTKIEDECTNKKDTLTKIKTIPFRYRFNLVDKKFYYLHSIPIIYSLWEGFFQIVIEFYLKYLNEIGIETNKINNSLLIFVAEYTEIKIQNYPQKELKKLEYLEKLKKIFGNQFVELPIVVNTESNLKFKPLNLMLKNIGLIEFSEFEQVDNIPIDIKNKFFPNTPQKYPIEDELRHLVDIRNDISHTSSYQDAEITEIYIDRFIFLVNYLIEQISEKIKKAIENKTYLKEEFRNT